jgi:hypothetical protein
MPDHRSSASDDRVVNIRTRRPFEATGSAKVPPSADLGSYERDSDPDDFRHRMMVNAIAFLFVTALVLAGLWLANTITTMRKTQDCILTGKRGCAPMDAPTPAR